MEEKTAQGATELGHWQGLQRGQGACEQVEAGGRGGQGEFSEKGGGRG